MKEFPPFRLDPADQSLWRDGRRISITPKAFAVLNYLVDRAGRLVTQSELLEALWPDTFVQPEVLKSQILDVRSALGDRPKDPLFIETVPRRGYRFIAAVHQAAASVRNEIVGRDETLNALRQSLSKAQTGERQLVFVTGEPGIGKTTVVDAFLQQVDGATVARGQCLEGFGSAKEPYYPVLEAIGHLSREPVGPALAEILERYAPTWLIQMPALLKPGHRESLQRELLGATRERMIREICEALERLTESQTLILFFEDLHWSDASTVDLIASLAHRRTRARFMLIGTYRPVDIVLSSHPLKQVSHSLRTHRLCREIALTPFQGADVAEYLNRRSGGPTESVEILAAWLHRQTDGNPLFLVNVVEHLQHLGRLTLQDGAWHVNGDLADLYGVLPETLRQAIELQVERLSPAEQLALEAASVQGESFSAAIVSAVLEISTESCDDVYQRLARQNYIIRSGSVNRLADGSFSQRFEFVHAAFRSALYQRPSPARRAKLHRLLAEVIERQNAGNLAKVAFELAGHFECCGDWLKAVEYLELGAKQAWQRFDYRDAVATLQQALRLAANLEGPDQISTETRVLAWIAILQHALYDTQTLVPTIEELANRGEKYGIAELASRSLIALAALRSTDNAIECIPILDRLEVFRLRQKDPNIRTLVRAQWLSLRVTIFGWNAEYAREHTELLEQIRASGDRLGLSASLMDHAFLQWAASNYRVAVQCAQECIPALIESGRLVRFLQGRDLVATNLALLGKWGEALDILEHDIEEAKKNSAPMRMLMPLLFKAWIHLQAADYATTIDICESAITNLQGSLLKDRRWIAMQFLGAAKVRSGDLDMGLRQLITLRDEVNRHSVMLSWYWRMPLQLELAYAHLAANNLEMALLEADRAVELTSATAERTWQALALELRARITHSEEDIVRALRVIEGAELPLASWRVYRTAGLIAESRKVVQEVTESLTGRPELQRSFLQHVGE